MKPAGAKVELPQQEIKLLYEEMEHQLEYLTARAIFRHQEQRGLPVRLAYRNLPAGAQLQPTSAHELVILASTTVPVELRTHQHSQLLLVAHQLQHLPELPLQPTTAQTGLAPHRHHNLQPVAMIMNAPVVQVVVHLAAIPRYPVHHLAVHQVHQVAVQAELQLLEGDS